MKLSAEHTIAVDDRKADLKELKPERRATDSMLQAETIDPSRSLNVDQAALCDVINAQAKRQVTGRF